MKILVIPDVHETNAWEVAIPRVNEFDKIIFLGDYFDYHGEATGIDKFKNFKKICDFKKANSEKVEIIIGNHDNTYLIGERTNVFQYAYAKKINKILKENFDLLKMAVEYDGYVFSHAGISKHFMALHKLNSIEEINEKFKENQIFGFSPFDQSGWGNSIFASPTWIRPSPLLQDAAYNKQVVGHTAIDTKTKFVCYGDNKVIFTDTPEHNCLFELDTTKEYEYISATVKKVTVNKIAIVQREDKKFNVWIEYDSDFTTNVSDPTLIPNVESVEKAKEEIEKLFNDLREDGIHFADIPEPEIIEV